MKPGPFDYIRPTDLQEALHELHSRGDAAKPLAGGQSLIPLLRFRLTYVDALIDIAGLEELHGVAVDANQSLRIAACTTHREIARSADVRAHCPLLASTAPLIAHEQIRNRGTLGGSLAHADPAAELPATMVALDAQLEVSNSRRTRTIGAGEFFLSYFTTQLEDDELLTAVTVPPAKSCEGSAIIEVARRPGDFALAGVAVRVAVEHDSCELARIVVFGAGARPVRILPGEEALLGTKLTPDDRASAAACVAGELDPPSDVHASASYRRHAATVLCSRALEQACRQLGTIEAGR